MKFEKFTQPVITKAERKFASYKISTRLISKRRKYKSPMDELIMFEFRLQTFVEYFPCFTNFRRDFLAIQLVKLHSFLSRLYAQAKNFITPSDVHFSNSTVGPTKESYRSCMHVRGRFSIKQSLKFHDSLN